MPDRYLQHCVGSLIDHSELVRVYTHGSDHYDKQQEKVTFSSSCLLAKNHHACQSFDQMRDGGHIFSRRTRLNRIIFTNFVAQRILSL